MSYDTPLSPRPLHHLTDIRHRVMTSRQLREHGVTSTTVNERCRPGGPWQPLLPGVYLLHSGPASGEERLHAALLYTLARTQGVPRQPGPQEDPAAPYGQAMITGLAALALHGFATAPPPAALDRIEVLVPSTRRLRPAGFVRPVRAHTVPRPRLLAGVPVAPVARAVADAVAALTQPAPVRALLAEAVRGGHCEPSQLVRELSRSRVLHRPAVQSAVDGLLAESRAAAEGRLYALVAEHALPAPLWNVELWLPGGPCLGAVDAFWPDHGVVVEIDTRAPHTEEGMHWSEPARRGERLERLGVAVVHLTPRQLAGDAGETERHAAVVRTALASSAERDPAAYLVVLPK
ncbi:hypothetical protein [Streptomyces orinoci]|uniref:Transcriptional regulator, AbiEi antitoxin, Type IV TA system n=1 Tax=Streptomyces orinoci TaxID=67339 RepID=A0ABV3JQP9_STRON|nr:hypothetical protein [Streptomyces orinoci]